MTRQGTTIHTRKLPNGMTLLFEPMPWLPSVSLTIMLPLGAATDPEGREGSATVLHEWVSRGAGELDSRGFTEALDALGVRRGGSAGVETSTWSASLLATALPAALPLLADELRRPRLATGEFEGARELALQELASLEDQPMQRMFEHLHRRLFRSPHGRSAYGTREGLAALDPESVRADYERRFSPEGAVMAVAGGVGWEELQDLVEGIFGDWRGPKPERPGVEIAPAERHHVSADTAQVQIGLAYPGLGPTDTDWYLQSLALNVLSGGMGSRLFSEVREKRGLVYSVGASAQALRGYGYILGYAGTTPEKAQETLDVMTAEFEGLSRGVMQDEFTRARDGILSSLVMQGESSGARAAALVRDQYLRGAPRTLDAITDAYTAISLNELNDFVNGRTLAGPMVLTLGPDGAAAEGEK